MFVCVYIYMLFFLNVKCVINLDTCCLWLLQLNELQLSRWTFACPISCNGSYLILCPVIDCFWLVTLMLHMIWVPLYNFANEYIGNDQIALGSEQSLPITHSGCGLLPTPHVSFNSQNHFRVQIISSNLLSVNHLCVDNNCIIIFYFVFFIIQDK